MIPASQPTIQNNIPIMEQFIIAPREFCSACLSASGPKFVLTELRGPSAIHRASVVPTGRENDIAEANIAYAQSEAALLDTEITRIQRTLDILQQRRNALKLFETQERGLFAAIRKIPVDVLRRIFGLLLDDYPLSCSNPHSFPRIAERVSSHWRAIAYSCAWMWKDFAIGFSDNVNPAIIKELVKNCVAFSREMPLNISLGRECTPEVLGEHCIQALASSAYRWKRLSIMNEELLHHAVTNIPTELILEHLESLTLSTSLTLLNPTPQLKYLNINDCIADDPDNIRIHLHSAPSLTTLHIRSVQNPLSMLTDTFPWAQITELDLSCVEFAPDELCHMLENMSGLSSLNFTGPTEATRSVLVPNLAKLELCGFDETNLLDFLTAPSLKKLIFDWGDFDSEKAVQFGQRSHFSLDELKLISMDIAPFLMVPEFARIRSLEWEDPIYFGRDIHLLTNGVAPSPLDIFPRLETLIIRNLDRDDGPDVPWTVAQIINMLKSRLPTSEYQEADTSAQRRYLKKVHIYFGVKLGQDDVKQFADFAQSVSVQNSEVEIYIAALGD